MLARIEKFGFAGGIKLILSNYDYTNTNTSTEQSLYLSHEEVLKLYKFLNEKYFNSISNFNVGGNNS